MPNNNDNNFIGFDDLNAGSLNASATNPDITNQDDKTDFVEESQTSQNRMPTPRHSITVTLTDKKAPIILLFGAPSTGKTMTLVRLAKYLRPKGYQLVVDANFCDIWEYSENMKNFNEMLSTQYALKGTNLNDFLLVKILDRQGNTVCQILEGAGEDYFSSTTVAGRFRSQAPFPPYMANVFASGNKKVWLFITEPNCPTSNDSEEHKNPLSKTKSREEYVDRIRFCKHQHFGRRDKCIIIYNKIDKTPFANGTIINMKAARAQCISEYPGIFQLFPNNSPLPSFLKDPYDCKFVPFNTGTYGEYVPGYPQSYTPSKDEYPQKLWEEIMNCIKG